MVADNTIKTYAKTRNIVGLNKIQYDVATFIPVAYAVANSNSAYPDITANWAVFMSPIDGINTTGNIGLVIDLEYYVEFSSPIIPQN